MKVCYCHTLEKVDNDWPIHILQHSAESKHAIGTARIAVLSLSQCQLQVGDRFDDADLSTWLSHESSPVLVYPGEDSEDLSLFSKQSPRPLVFLDASWRKSRRMLHESPALMQLPKVSFQPKQVSRYRIRKAPERHALSTLEAIVYALSFLENEEEKYHSLLRSMDWMIEKQIEIMGREVFEKNYQHYFKGNE